MKKSFTKRSLQVSREFIKEGAEILAKQEMMVNIKRQAFNNRLGLERFDELRFIYEEFDGIK